MRNGKKRRGKRQETYNRALHVLARMRRTGATLTAAAREDHIDPRTVRKYLGADFRGRGKTTKADRRRREMLIPTAIGNAPVTVRGSKQASQLGKYMTAVGKYGGHLLINDPDTLTVLAQAAGLLVSAMCVLRRLSFSMGVEAAGFGANDRGSARFLSGT